MRRLVVVWLSFVLASLLYVPLTLLPKDINVVFGDGCIALEQNGSLQS